MAYFTVELSSMLASYATLVDPDGHGIDFEVVSTVDGDGHSFVPSSNQYVHLPLYQTQSGEMFEDHDFLYFPNNTPNYLINKYTYPMALQYCGHLKDNITNQPDLNQAIIAQFLQTFWRHFYGYEIGQEDPLYWWVIFKDWYDENIDFFIQAYQKMILENQNFITGLSHTTGTNKGNIQTQATTDDVAHSTTTNDSQQSSIAGVADTPQNELDFKLNTGDPAQDYNFNYSSNVTGTKAHNVDTTETNSTDNTKSNSNQDSINDAVSDTEARSQTIADLVNQLDRYFDNGIYLNLFEKARKYGLFMNVIH